MPNVCCLNKHKLLIPDCLRVLVVLNHCLIILKFGHLTPSCAPWKYQYFYGAPSPALRGNRASRESANTEGTRLAHGFKPSLARKLLLKFGVLDIENFQNLKKSFMLKTSQNGQKNDLQPKKSKFLKIWGVALKNCQNLKKTFQLKTSQNGQKNDLLPKKSKVIYNPQIVTGRRHFHIKYLFYDPVSLVHQAKALFNYICSNIQS